jgi:SAM-dependent methyltransferase
MDCAAQGAELLAPYLTDKEKIVLDVGCGGGHFYHALRRRNFNFSYYGLDSSPAMIEIAREVLLGYGLGAERCILGDIRDLTNFKCQIVALINTLSFNSDFRAIIERLADTQAEVILIRDNFGPQTEIKWETDSFLDPGFNHLKAYWNRWSISEVQEFLCDLGYSVRLIEDKHTQGQMELVVNKPYYWSWILASK